MNKLIASALILILAIGLADAAAQTHISDPLINTTGNLSIGAFISDLIGYTDNTHDIGNSTNEVKDIYIDGIAYLDAISILVDIIPETDDTTNIGNSSNELNDIYVDGLAYIDQLGENLDVNAKVLSNIGAAGTDFNGTGALTLADKLTVTAGGITVTAGGIDMTNDAITNIGAAGTDFTATGGLTLADILTVSSGGASITGTITDGTFSVLDGAFTAIASIADGTATWAANSSLLGFVNIDLTGDLTPGTITATGFSVDADGDTKAKTLGVGATIVINADPDIINVVDIDGSGDLTMATVTMTGFSVDADGDLVAKTINTGQGVTEVYLMNQDVQTTDAVTYHNITATVKVTSTEYIIGANTLTTTEWAFLDGQDQAVAQASSVEFAGITQGGDTVLDVSGVDGSNITAGTVADARLEATIDRTAFSASGAMTAATFVIGANTLSTAEWAFLDGVNQSLDTAATVEFAVITQGGDTVLDVSGIDGGNITAGTVADARLEATINVVTSLVSPIVDTPLIQDASYIEIEASGDSDDNILFATPSNLPQIISTANIAYNTTIQFPGTGLVQFCAGGPIGQANCATGELTQDAGIIAYGNNATNNPPQNNWVRIFHDGVDGDIATGEGDINMNAEGGEIVAASGDAFQGDHKSSDGTAGATTTCADGTSLTVKDGLITACS